MDDMTWHDMTCSRHVGTWVDRTGEQARVSSTTPSVELSLGNVLPPKCPFSSLQALGKGSLNTVSKMPHGMGLGRHKRGKGW